MSLLKQTGLAKVAAAGATGPTGPTGGTGPTGATGPTGPVGGGLSLQVAQVVLTGAQIAALNTTPIQAIAAPGAGKMIVVLSTIYNSLDTWTTTAQTGLYYGDLARQNAADVAGLNDINPFNKPQIGLAIAPIEAAVGDGGQLFPGDLPQYIINQPINIATTGAAPTGGTLGATVTIIYVVATP